MNGFMRDEERDAMHMNTAEGVAASRVDTPATVLFSEPVHFDEFGIGVEEIEVDRFRVWDGWVGYVYEGGTHLVPSARIQRIKAVTS